MSKTLLLASFITCYAFTSCVPETETRQLPRDSANANVIEENNTHIKPYTPDNNWITPLESVSQYGPGGIVRDVVIDRNGMMWLAAWDGIISYDGKQFTNHTLKQGLSHHRVYSVMQDSKGNLWFGTMGAGAYKYDGNIFTNLGTNNGMIDNVVFDLFEDNKGNIWFATPKGASKYDGRSFVNLDSTQGLNQEIYALSQDADETIWFGGEGGLFQYTASVRDTSVVEILTDQKTHYANVRDLFWSNGTMYIGAARGLYITKPLSNVPLKITSIDDRFTSYINSDRAGNLLLTSDGIYRYNILTSGSTNADQLIPEVEDKSALGIFGAREAADGTIWYGAMDGLHAISDGKDRSFKKP